MKLASLSDNLEQETQSVHLIRSRTLTLSLIPAARYIFACLVPSIQTGERFVNTAPINEAPVATFLWTTTFPLGEMYCQLSTANK